MEYDGGRDFFDQIGIAQPVTQTPAGIASVPPRLMAKAAASKRRHGGEKESVHFEVPSSQDRHKLSHV